MWDQFEDVVFLFCLIVGGTIVAVCSLVGLVAILLGA